MQVTITAITPDKKIQAVKEIRMMTGLGLREAKQIADEVDKGHRMTFNTVDRNGYRWDRDSILQAMRNGHMEGDIGPQSPLPIHLLAIKLFGVHKFTIEQVQSFADALHGIEDAEGSLKECIRMYQEVGA